MKTNKKNSRHFKSVTCLTIKWNLHIALVRGKLYDFNRQKPYKMHMILNFVTMIW